MEVICACFDVTKNQIIEAINNGASTVDEVGEVTNAGTGCGACRDEIQNIINSLKSK
ncbi:(2Fe-2S)-binding protein [Clostridium sp. 'deep sea']|uniref:(2Fe-2S)-binding protein n=1 Tax=Clostridium sp. 'deep sea' TaxID=2779445 RepID=UPI00189663A5|nr:(2Fe-2S)-binding protein [Clostridium sp. 'deep sea']QOR35524.1 (2Fe-2S)-binding protein [Clostridium sp. 'deep sea']